MSQSKQMQKAKLYRVLKIVFYTLGLPLFFFAVFCTAIKYIGEDPFVGMASSSLSSGVFEGYERFFTSSALYGIWCALAVWVFIAICHGLLSKTVKNFRARLFSMLAIILVVMLGTMGIMDSAFEAKINKLIADAPAGVTIEDYESQLSYYDYVSYGRHKDSLVNKLMSNVEQYKKVYNIEYQGVNKSGEAGNISNKPVTYAELVSDPDKDGNVTVGYDVDGDDEIGANEQRLLVEVAPNKSGKLVLGGKTYSNYFYTKRTGSNGHDCYVWYSTDLVPLGYKWNAKKGKMTYNTAEGVYGEGLYNESGLLSDGWVFSFENMLEILEDVYAGQEYFANVDKNEVLKNDRDRIQERARELREQYYAGEIELPSTGKKVDPRVQAIYEQEDVHMGEFMITRARLEQIVSYLGETLGDNGLFDWLFLNDNAASLLGDIDGFGVLPLSLSNLIKNGDKGISFKSLLPDTTLDEETKNMIVNLVGTAFGVELNDFYIVLAYKNEGNDAAVVQTNHLYLGVYKDNGSGAIDKEGELFKLDFQDERIGDGYAFDLDSLSDLLNDVLNMLLSDSSIGDIFNTLSGLVLQEMTFNGQSYMGLSLGGFDIPLINSATKQVDIDLVGILTNILQGLYTYQSPLIKPVWEFYGEAALDLFDEFYTTADGQARAKEVASYLADYERAYYEATVYGPMIGSTLIGDTLGAGSYTAAQGLADLAAVRQLKSDLSYQPKNFPLYNFRDMLLTSSGIVMLFYLLFMIAAEKEKKYAACACESNDGDGKDDGEAKKSNAFTDAMARAKQSVSAACGKVKASVTKAADGFKEKTNWNDKKTSLASKIAGFSLYGIAFLPLLIISLVMAVKSSKVLPAYSAWHYLGFIILLVFALIFAAVVVLLNVRLGKKDKRKLGSMASRGMRIGIAFVCLTTVFGLLLTYVLPDPIAKATSSTLWAEDMYYNNEAQVEENAALERQFIMYNLLDGNLNHYDSKTGQVTAKGDFAYEVLKKRHPEMNGRREILVYDNPYIKASIDSRVGIFKDKTDPAEIAALFDSITKDFPEHKMELYNFIYQYKVLADWDFAFGYGDYGVQRRLLALAITDYVYDNANYEQLLTEGFSNPKIKQLFDNNYDSFNLDGYKTFDDPLLLYAQMDGRMTIPVVVRLILNRNWTYTQPEVDGLKEGKVLYGEGAFLYEMYSPETLEEYRAANEGKTDAELFPNKGELTGHDGSKLTVNYGVNSDGWEIYANGVVRRPLNWLVLDMLGDPMALTSIDLSTVKVFGFGLADLISGMLDNTGLYEGIDQTLNDDVFKLLNVLTNGAGLRVGVYLDDVGALQIQIVPMNSEYAMLGYMQATWVQSNNLLMAVINIEALRNYMYLFGGIGLIIILIGTLILELAEKADGRLALAAGEAETPAEEGAHDEAHEETSAEEAPAEDTEPKAE